MKKNEYSANTRISEVNHDNYKEFIIGDRKNPQKFSFRFWILVVTLSTLSTGFFMASKDLETLGASLMSIGSAGIGFLTSRKSEEDEFNK
ncbi:hypothetical protein [Nostoc sp. CALU 546]|uniref:hypothetical protein n=1 Tax=Nostoc sp. CALU 546 TaxID=1867241 RepID=UPI003B67CD3F